MSTDALNEAIIACSDAAFRADRLQQVKDLKAKAQSHLDNYQTHVRFLIPIVVR